MKDSKLPPEAEEEVIFPSSNVKEAVQRWEKEFRVTQMTTVDLDSSIRMEDNFQDECDGENCDGRRPDPPTKDEEDSDTRQPLLLSSNPKLASTKQSSQSSQVPPDPEEQLMRRPHYDWFQPLPALSSPPTTTVPTTRHRCNSSFQRRFIVLISTGFLIVAILVPWLFLRQKQTSEQQLLHFIDYLAGHGISSREDLERYDSAQFRAAAWSVQWKSDEDALNRYVLAVLYFALNGESWPMPFLSDRHLCEWKTKVNETVLGVTACQLENTGLRGPTGLALGKWLKVFQSACPCKTNLLILPGFKVFEGLSGTLPTEIRHLSNLESLQIDHNLALGGSLPTSIRRLTRLTSLSFAGCSIGGTLPTWLGDLTQLKELTLSENRLRGSIPSELVHLTNLQALRLNGNLLSSPLQLLSSLSNLQLLHLHDNLIQGHLDESTTSNWTQLVDLDLSENHLAGSISKSLFGHATLERINLHGNRLTGSIPLIEDPNTVLNSLRLHFNELEGSIPPSISQLIALQDLDLSGNTLTGTLPETLSAMSNLQEIYLGDNDYTPNLFPKILLRLVNLRAISLSRSSLTGKLPDSIGFLSHLQSLDLSENSLRGSLPDSLGYLSSLRQLSVRFNLLTGSLPDTMLHWNDLGTSFSLCFSLHNIPRTHFPLCR